MDTSECRQQIFQMRQPGRGIDLHRKHIGVTVGGQSGKTVRFAVGQTPGVGVFIKQVFPPGRGFFRQLPEKFGTDVRRFGAEGEDPQTDVGIRIDQRGSEFAPPVEQHGNVARFQSGRHFFNGIFEDPRMTRTDRLQSFCPQVDRGDPRSTGEQFGHLTVCRVRRNVPRPRPPL